MTTATPMTATILHAPRAALTTIGGWLRAITRAVMVARMTQVYHAMNDAQLAQIGLTRADIPSEARRLSGLPR